MDWTLLIVSIIISILTILFWVFFFLLFCVWFPKIKRSHVRYNFREGLVRKRFPSTVYYLQNILFWLVIAIFIGFAAFVDRDTQVTFWCVALVLSALNVLNIFVFWDFVENLNHNVSNILLVWVTFYCTCLIGAPEVRISRERQAKGLIFVYIIVLGTLCLISILVSFIKIFKIIRKGIWNCWK